MVFKLKLVSNRTPNLIVKFKDYTQPLFFQHWGKERKDFKLRDYFI